MHIVIAGATGFLGSHLTEHLRTGGHEVTALTRRPAGGGESRWDPYAGRIDRDVIADAEAVVNLAGSPTAGNPHSPRWARNLRDSRVATTRLLAETIAGTGAKAAFLAGNGISYYGDHGQSEVTEESSSNGDAFMTTVTRDWEAAAEPAAEAGARVCILRTSPVLDKRSAPLKQLLPLFRLGLGARLGSGNQYFPCISRRDWVGAVTHLLTSELSGPVNLCCPMTPTNAEFTEAVARAVRRRARLVVPKQALAVGAGRLSNELLGSVNVRPEALEHDGYRFRDHDVRDIVSAALS